MAYALTELYASSPGRGWRLLAQCEVIATANDPGWREWRAKRSISLAESRSRIGVKLRLSTPFSHVRPPMLLEIDSAGQRSFGSDWP